jgi:hypothetical protein
LQEILKQIGTAVVTAALPYLIGKIPLLPFLNPQIAADVGAFAAVLSFAAAIYAYNIGRPPPAPTPSPLMIVVGAFGLVVALAGLFLLLTITDGLVIETYARIAFVACFVGIALTIGIGAGRLLR